MKSRDIKALKQKTIEELTKEVTVKRLEVNKLQLERKVKQIKNTSLMTNLKKDIARILTNLKEKELAQNKEKEIKK